MPELPEVQAHVERLGETFVGRVLSGFTPLSFSVLRTYSPRPDEAIGLTLDHVGRRGKFMLMTFAQGNPQVTFVIHLMQAGRLIPDEKKSAKPRNGLARWTFEDGSALLLTEAGRERKAGIWVLEGDPLAGDGDESVDGGNLVEPLTGLGVEADSVTLDQLRTALGAKNQRLHGFLRDQHGIAGLGRLLANEICFRAQLSPFAMTRSLDDDATSRLLEAIHGAIEDALVFERSRAEMSKSADRPANVHHRAGGPCPRCGEVIRSVTYNAYEVDYCASCQTGGKVLADNTTSKFLR
ncbi:MAG: hypothetical protein KDB26_10865 [Microthrixaceae bacterium]|nr:hypothetical protein [Microthrixaceae bacterium]